MFKKLRYDIAAIKKRDPAAKSGAQVFFFYPGLWAVFWHRLACFLHRHRLFFLARMVSHNVRFWTGIEIHPAAKIGRGLLIDHGSGVVIGETAEVGDDCTIYQGVTLGGTGKDTGKRHPTIGNDVLIGAGAKVLGPLKIGNGAKIAAGAVVLDDVPENCTAVGVPARVVRRGGVPVSGEMDQVNIPDPVAQEFCRMTKKLNDIEKELEKLKAVTGFSKDEPYNQTGKQKI